MARATGPVPKRSETRIRRNKDGGEIEKLPVSGQIAVPDLDIENCHPMIQDFYDSLKESAQSKYYEPSDWQYARFVLHFANKQLLTSKPSAQMVTGINSALGELLVSEGARRRVRLEIEREQTTGTVVDIAEMFRQRMAAA